MKINVKNLNSAIKILKNNNHITSVSFAGNMLGAKSAKVISAVLKNNKTLKSLNLSDNLFTDEDAKLFLDIIESTNITELNFAGNKLSKEMKEAIDAKIRARNNKYSTSLSPNQNIDITDPETSVCIDLDLTYPIEEISAQNITPLYFINRDQNQTFDKSTDTNNLPSDLSNEDNLSHRKSKTLFTKLTKILFKLTLFIIKDLIVIPSLQLGIFTIENLIIPLVKLFTNFKYSYNHYFSTPNTESYTTRFYPSDRNNRRSDTETRGQNVTYSYNHYFSAPSTASYTTTFYPSDRNNRQSDTETRDQNVTYSYNHYFSAPSTESYTIRFYPSDRNNQKR